MAKACPPKARGDREIQWWLAAVPAAQEAVHLFPAADCTQVGLPAPAIWILWVLWGLRGLSRLRTQTHGVSAQPPGLQLTPHAGEEVQHAAVCEVPRMLAAGLVEELLLQVHVVAPIPALQEDCLVEAGPQAAGQEGGHDQQQGEAPADGLSSEEAGGGTV